MQYQTLERDGDKVEVHAFRNGAEVHRNDEDDFAAFDSQGRYVGFHCEEHKAAAMAESGRLNHLSLDSVCPLDLWQLWNAAIDGGTEAMTDLEGNQFIALDNNTWLDRKSTRLNSSH